MNIGYKYSIVFLIIGLAQVHLVFGQTDPCYQRIGVEGGDFGWSYADGDAPSDPVVEVFAQPATNAGFTLDIYELDNSFNMEINGVDLATQEIEFQSNGTSGINIRFADGDQYETDTQGDIWQMFGDANNPLIRVKIAPDGTVTLWGSKESYGPLFELELINGNSLNTITWNTTGTNTIITSQNVVGVTSISGAGYGLSEIPCEDMYSITKEGMFVDENNDSFAQVGEHVEFTFIIEHTGNHEAVYDVKIVDPFLSPDPIELSAGVNLMGGTLTGDDGNNILNIGEVWTFTVSYPITETDIYWNKGVYNLSTIVCARESGQQLPQETSTDPTPYQAGDQGWDPTRSEHTFVFLNAQGTGLLITNPMLPSKGKN